MGMITVILDEADVSLAELMNALQNKLDAATGIPASMVDTRSECTSTATEILMTVRARDRAYLKSMNDAQTD